MYILVCIYKCVYIYIYIYLYTYVLIYLYIYILVYLYTYIWEWRTSGHACAATLRSRARSSIGTSALRPKTAEVRGHTFRKQALIWSCVAHPCDLRLP